MWYSHLTILILLTALWFKKCKVLLVILLHLNIVYELSEYMAFTQSFSVLKLSSFYTKHKSLSTAHGECLCQLSDQLFCFFEIWALAYSSSKLPVIYILVNQFSFKKSLVHIFIHNTRYIYFGKTNCYWKLSNNSNLVVSPVVLFFISLKNLTFSLGYFKMCLLLPLFLLSFFLLASSFLFLLKVW